MENEKHQDEYQKLFAAMRSTYELQKAKVDKQKATGRHDYNIFTTLLKKSDEVNLHSKFIASILDTNSDHYRENLFLELFIDSCGLDEFEIDSEIASVYRESDNMDIYISDGTKHIIIENKVHATDRNTQIQRYIDAIREKKDAEIDDIYVLYLNLYSNLPQNYSLGEYEVKKQIDDNNFILKSGIKLKVITYKDEILPWIQKCKNEASNIIDLNAIFMQYQSVIKMLYNEYERIDKMPNETLKIL